MHRKFGAISAIDTHIDTKHGYSYCIYVDICLYVYVYVRLCHGIATCSAALSNVAQSTHTSPQYIHTHVTYTYAYICIYMYIYIYVYVCTYIYMYMYDCVRVLRYIRYAYVHANVAKSTQ